MRATVTEFVRKLSMRLASRANVARLTCSCERYLSSITISLPLASAVFLFGTLNSRSVAQTATKHQFSEARVHIMHIDQIFLVKVIVL